MAIEKSSNTKIIETPFIRVENNCLEFKNTFIQLSNISLFSTEPIRPSYRLLSVAIIMILMGISFFSFTKTSSVILIGVGAVCGFIWYSNWKKAVNSCCMTIITNSGMIYPIVFMDKKFLKEVVTVMIDIMKNPGNARTITVNVNECTFSDDASVVENMIDIN